VIFKRYNSTDVTHGTSLVVNLKSDIYGKMVFTVIQCIMVGMSMVSMFTIIAKVHRLKPGQGNGFLRAIKIGSTPFFGGEVKTLPPHTHTHTHAHMHVHRHPHTHRRTQNKKKLFWCNTNRHGKTVTGNDMLNMGMKQYVFSMQWSCERLLQKL
jgi:hypothetical protein